jgi:hypothetical protein
MAKDESTDCKEEWHHHHHGGNAGAGAVYGLGLIGALVYYLQGVSGLNEILMGIFKSLVWPAFLIFRVLQLLNM